MTKLLCGLAGGRVILALEGGYHLPVISQAMVYCSKALLGDPLPPLDMDSPPNARAVETLHNVLNTHKQYWSALNYQVNTNIFHQIFNLFPFLQKLRSLYFFYYIFSLN